MAVSKAAVSNTTSAGGNEFAPQQLKSAMEKMDAAKRVMAEKDYLRACPNTELTGKWPCV